ncbi:hypothetical protein [Pseudomonas sp. DCA-1]|uniref:hypothetical protein n=1 Tax=Pseudomonas sp. DCA-1 TaxID=3344874 RepID=UPI0039774694
MGKRKIFAKTDIGIPGVEHCRDDGGKTVILPDAFPLSGTTVEFERSPSNCRSFNFSRWYGAGIDTITHACQRQIERFLAGQDRVVSIQTITSYCLSGLRSFLDYCSLRATAAASVLTLKNINRDLIDGYLIYLAGLDYKKTSQKCCYTATKSVLVPLGQRGFFDLINFGDAATFPTNPFPYSNHKAVGETALSKHERQAFSVALREAIKPIWNEDVILTSDLLAFALLVVALHTGSNTTPLLEMDRNCLRPHPKDNTVFLVLWKRRGYNTIKVALRSDPCGERLLESTPCVHTNVERLIRRVEALTRPLDAEAPDDLKGRVWLYRPRGGKDAGKVTSLSVGALYEAVSRLVTDYRLRDSAGEPLRINVSRLRKTFANRIFELSGGNLAITAAALGNTLRVADQNYLAPDSDARHNWQFMGELLVRELLTQTIGASYKDTPVGQCADPINGQYAPKNGNGATCTNFMNCLRCKHYAVTAEDLHKVFSYYYRVLSERSRMDKRRWARDYAHIPRLIDHYIVTEGLRRGTFKSADVDAARERARAQPHPFWSVDLLDSLEVFT